jgi:hypothetical protein
MKRLLDTVNMTSGQVIQKGQKNTIHTFLSIHIFYTSLDIS